MSILQKIADIEAEVRKAAECWGGVWRTADRQALGAVWLTWAGVTVPALLPLLLTFLASYRL